MASPRKGCCACLGERNDALVYEEAKWVVLDLFEMWKAEGQRDMVAGNNMADLTSGTITVAGFSFEIIWRHDGKVPGGYHIVRIVDHALLLV